MTMKMLILASQTMVGHSSVHPANLLFSSGPDKPEAQVPEGEVMVLCCTNAFELHMNEDPGSEIQNAC